jgi:hypothetical protein
MWSLPVALCFAHRGDVPLHAAAVEVEGEAVLLAAPRTWGKTTLAAGFVAAGYRLLSEDLSCVRASEAPLVIPGPAMLRIRHDVADRISVDGAEPVGRDDDRVHFALQPSTRGSSSPVPLRALVLLRPSDEPPCLTRVPQAEALPDLWSLGFRLPGEASFRAAFGGLAELVDHVPVWNFFRPLRLDALDAAVEALVAGLQPQR